MISNTVSYFYMITQIRQIWNLNIVDFSSPFSIITSYLLDFTPKLDMVHEWIVEKHHHYLWVINRLSDMYVIFFKCSFCNYYYYNIFVIKLSHVTSGQKLIYGVAYVCKN